MMRRSRKEKKEGDNGKKGEKRLTNGNEEEKRKGVMIMTVR